MRSLLPLVAWAATGCIVHGGGAPPASGGGITPAPSTGSGAAAPGAAFASGRGSADLPVPPRCGVPRPNGAPGNLAVLDWAGFKAAVSWRAQKLFAGITPTTSGNSTTWNGTLPPHFPPGRVLRVKVDGGTLTQPGGRTLAWNDHGYYEVALDAGSLTLSP